MPRANSTSLYSMMNTRTPASAFRLSTSASLGKVEGDAEFVCCSNEVIKFVA